MTIASTSPEPTSPAPLSTLERDGRRRWVHPTVSRGRYFYARLVVALVLVATFVLLPLIRVGGKPAMQIDFQTRRMHLFGQTFFATDTLLLPVFGVGLVLSIALLTALFGRVWCGWACPQTVYMEFVFRPLETLFEGAASRRRKQGPLTTGRLVRKIGKWAAFLMVAAVLAHAFVAYFVGADELFAMVLRDPRASWSTFVAVVVVTALVFFDFTFFREQTCVLACPYGRLQSVLIDSRSMIVGYDERRGEPRGKLRRSADPERVTGDCIDCGACVRTCPTGIDIRQGLQLECVGCTQCIDACDAVMVKIGKPRGLIRYSSLDQLRGKPSRLLRPRVLVYLAVVLVAASVMTILLTSRSSFEFDVVRRTGAPFYMQSDGQVVNRVRLRLTNRTRELQAYKVEVQQPPGAHLILVENPVSVEPGAVRAVEALVTLAPEALRTGRLAATVQATSADGTQESKPFVLLGPQRGAL